MTLSDDRRRIVPRCSLIAVIASALLGGCASSEAREPAATDSTRAGVVDSILPMDEALRRFRADLNEVSALSGGADSRDELVRRFVRALESRDTAAIRALVLDRAEYAWLYYPTSTFAHEPFYQMPQLNWLLTVEDSRKGIGRAMTRYGGTDLRFAGYACPDTAQADGGMRFWHRCTVRFTDGGVEQTMRLFGSIAEYRSTYKFYSYANDL
ncbi:MAG TPA: hypothetical protein VK922_06925 [Gemmatimonadaceae bacterium]|nr:hypothetical protein [Gemmatimonadaceae bacterium]